jgi:hypothetical protein
VRVSLPCGSDLALLLATLDELARANARVLNEPACGCSAPLPRRGGPDPSP